MTSEKLKAVIREVLSSRGLDVKGDLKVSMRFPGEGYGVIKIESYDKFVKLFSDGRYFIECHNINIRGIEEQGAFTIAFMLIDSEYKNNKWTVNLFTDEEETWVSDIEHLEKRRKKLIEGIKQSLELLTFVVKLGNQDDTKNN